MENFLDAHQAHTAAKVNREQRVAQILNDLSEQERENFEWHFEKIESCVTEGEFEVNFYDLSKKLVMVLRAYGYTVVHNDYIGARDSYTVSW